MSGDIIKFFVSLINGESSFPISMKRNILKVKFNFYFEHYYVAKVILKMIIKVPSFAVSIIQASK